MAEPSKTCCLRSCKDPRIRTSDGIIDVRAFSVDTACRSGMLAEWDDGGVATFHLNCWRRLRQSYRTNKNEENVSMTDSLSREKSMISEAMKTVEFHQPDNMIKYEATRIAAMLMKSKYAVAFTGAGISTSAGINDYRGIRGQWTERNKKKEYGNQRKSDHLKRQGHVLLVNVRPTYSHEALVKLIEMGYLKHVISQNTDGLHKLALTGSDATAESLTELHGNSYVEKCELCHAVYDTKHGHKQGMRELDVPPNPCSGCGFDHRTGRKCSVKGCDGYLKNTIINFGDNIDESNLERAAVVAEKADMMLCLGSSLLVSPANRLIQTGENKKRIVICNRQMTEYDCLCYELNGAGTSMTGSRVFGDCDVLMKAVMKRLLPQQQLQTWESEREKRVRQYDSQRMSIK